MNVLYNLGLHDIEIKNIVESNENILSMSDDEMNVMILLLKKIGCNQMQIRNILIGNPWYLDRCVGDVMNTVNKFKSLGLEPVSFFIYDNPLLLNVDVFEIDDFIIRKRKEQYSMDEIIAMIEENSNIITE